jgi:hypothetical protein
LQGLTGGFEVVRGLPLSAYIFLNSCIPSSIVNMYLLNEQQELEVVKSDEENIGIVNCSLIDERQPWDEQNHKTYMAA